MPSRSLPGLGVGLHQALLSTSCLWLWFPSCFHCTPHPPLLPTHIPLSTDILSSFLPPFLPLGLGAGVLSPHHGPPSPPLLSPKHRPLGDERLTRSSALPSPPAPSAGLWGREERAQGFLKGTTTPKVYAKATVVHTGSCSPLTSQFGYIWKCGLDVERPARIGMNWDLGTLRLPPLPDSHPPPLGHRVPMIDIHLPC